MKPEEMDKFCVVAIVIQFVVVGGAGGGGDIFTTAILEAYCGYTAAGFATASFFFPMAITDC